MKFRIKAMPNGTYICEVKTFFSWKIIQVDCLTQGDATRVGRGDIDMQYVLDLSGDYPHAIRYNKGSLKGKEDAYDRVKSYAALHGLMTGEFHLQFLT